MRYWNQILKAKLCELWIIFLPDCKMSSIISPTSLVLIAKRPSVIEAPKLCTFINNENGLMEENDEKSCQEGNGEKVFFVCRKDLACSKKFHITYIFLHFLIIVLSNHFSKQHWSSQHKTTWYTRIRTHVLANKLPISFCTFHGSCLASVIWPLFSI